MHSLREQFLDTIRSNIRRHGFHIYMIGGSDTPRFAYTIGLTKELGWELVMPGAAYFSVEQVHAVMHALRRRLPERGAAEAISVDGCGAFSLRRADRTWTRRLLLGAMDYYQRRDIEAMQVVPDADHLTIDVPDLGRRYAPEREPVWQWLTKRWPYAVPSGSLACTDLAALRGAPITEVVRLDDDYWEAFSGSSGSTALDQMRGVPIGTLLAIDPTLARAVTLRIGEGLERDGGGDEWRELDVVVQ